MFNQLLVLPVQINKMMQFIVLSVLLTLAAGVLGDKQNRIIGGNIIPIEHYPYMVSLISDNRLTCAGSIIAKDRILTSGNCVKGIDKSVLSIRAGSSEYKSDGEVIKIREVKFHPKFDKLDYDVAVLVLEKDLKLSKSVKIASIQPSGEEVEDDSDAIISGWGYTTTKPATKPPVSEILQGATVFIVNHDKCVEAYKGQYIVNDRMICAAANGKDSCKGDAGGPMTDLDAIIIGVISWGIDCANPKYPGVYAKVSHPEINQFIVNSLK